MSHNPAMAKRIGPVSHEEELSVVEHLDELRSRIIVVAVAFTAVLAVAFWQNDRVLDMVNRPLPEGAVPSTFGVSEAFMATLTVCSYVALIVTLPLIIWHVYAFVIPAFTEQERRVAKPLLLMTPLLFAVGAVFGYFLVLPTALDFLLNFNEDQFNSLLRASDYYGFFGLTVMAMGLLFELPLAILIATRVGLVTPDQLRQNRRFAIVIIAVVAMFLPSTDPVSLLIEMVPLLLLFEASIWLAVWFDRARTNENEADPTESAETGAAVR